MSEITENSDREEEFTDEQGLQPYNTDDDFLNRGVVTTPYDAPVRTLVEEINDKELIVNPPFQRRSVWTKERQSKLIESLLLNIPIPVLYFAEDDDGTRVVVDGQQRLRAIEEFRSGQYKLQGLQVLGQLNGCRWADLTQKQTRAIQTRTLRCVVISATSPATLRFEMFERLNTGGVPLNDQELRNCVYRGEFNDFLNELANDSQWLGLLGRSEPDNRMRHQELILRFFALHSVVKDYRPPLKTILNNFMRDNRNVSQFQKEQYSNLFKRTLANVQAVFGSHPFRRINGVDDGVDWDRNLNRAVFDLQMLGFVNIDSNEIQSKSKKILDKFSFLCLNDPEFLNAVSLATADRNRFYARLNIWGKALLEEGIEPEYLDSSPFDS